jgi:hypothetical protein
VGLIVWLLGRWSSIRREKKDAIVDLMANRGDYSSTDFRRALNRVSITFHDDEKIRTQMRELNEAINGGEVKDKIINRKIVTLIFDLCKHNSFKGITEYDIDQSFPEQRQKPAGG